MSWCSLSLSDKKKTKSLIRSEVRSGEGAALMSDGSANLMVPHAENRMAPLNAKTILIIDESNKGKGSAIVFELHR